jgi:hypothetical protein
VLGEVVVETLAGFELTIAGTILGSEVPFLGNLIGGGIGLAADYVLSKFRDHMNRDDFVAGNRAAVEATMLEWKEELAPELHKLTDIWMDDTQATVAMEPKS